ncbi:hypothetical protein AYO37_01045 [Opitutia bacterium SCGC AG-212-L18]|nr:hypothetical protein AYO37_01045 [Opitutae bacterium SCGC AG-212-L18]
MNKLLEGLPVVQNMAIQVFNKAEQFFLSRSVELVPGLVIGRVDNLRPNENLLNENAKEMSDKIIKWVCGGAVTKPKDLPKAIREELNKWQDLNDNELWSGVPRGQEAMMFEAMRAEILEAFNKEKSRAWIGSLVTPVSLINIVNEVPNPYRVNFASDAIKRMSLSAGVILVLWYVTGSFILSTFLLMLYNNFSAIKEFVQAQDWGKLKAT